MGKFTAVALGSLMVLGACARQPATFSITTPYSPQTTERYAATGPATLSGQAFLRTVGGDVRTCAGQDVMLFPDTAYYQELLGHMPGGQLPTNMPSEAKDAVRKTVCDAQGNFVFSNIPAAPYIIVASVSWTIPGEYFDSTQGGALRLNFSAQPGANRALLSDRNFWAR